MSMMDGISQCWWLSNTCSVNWAAWGAAGAWAASVATFLAVLLPYRSGLKRERFRSELTFLDFVPNLSEFADRVEEADEILQGFVELDRWPDPEELRYIIFKIELPAIEPVPALANLIVPLQDLRAEIKVWNQILDQLIRDKIKPEGVYRDRFITGLKRRIHEMRAIAALLNEEIGKSFPQLASRLK